MCVDQEALGDQDNVVNVAHPVLVGSGKPILPSIPVKSFPLSSED